MRPYRVSVNVQLTVREPYGAAAMQPTHISRQPRSAPCSMPVGGCTVPQVPCAPLIFFKNQLS